MTDSIRLKVLKMDEDFEILDERSIIIDISGDNYSADQLVRRAKIEIAEENLDLSVGVVYERVNTPVSSNIALENGYLVPLKGRYSNTFIGKGGSYEVRLVEKKEGTLGMDETMLDGCYSPNTGERAVETKENIRGNQSSFPKIQTDLSKPVVIVRSSILSDQQPSEKVIKESPETIENMTLTVFNGKVHLLDRILSINGGREIYNTFRKGEENKDIKQGLTRMLGNVLMENCLHPGNPSPEEKREVVRAFCKLTKRPDVEKQLSNTKNAGSLDNWVRRVRSKKYKKERLEREAIDPTPDPKKPKTDSSSEDSQPGSSTEPPVEICQIIPVVSISQNPSPSPILFSSNNEEDWENGAAFRL